MYLSKSAISCHISTTYHSCFKWKKNKVSFLKMLNLWNLYMSLHLIWNAKKCSKFCLKISKLVFNNLLSFGLRMWRCAEAGAAMNIMSCKSSYLKEKKKLGLLFWAILNYCLFFLFQHHALEWQCLSEIGVNVLGSIYLKGSQPSW